MASWPTTEAELLALQRELARRAPPAWRVPDHPLRAAGCFVCFERGEPGPGAAGDRGWAAAALMVRGRKLVATAVAAGVAGAPYRPGLLALREVGARPVAVHPGWRTDLDTAVIVALRSRRRARTPEPLRRARRAAREARARSRPAHR